MISVTALSEDLLASAIEKAASDIHFYPTSETTTIYFRIHGQREQNRTITTEHYVSLLSYYKFTAGMDIGEVRKPQSGVMIHKASNTMFSLRLSTLPTHKQESLVIRMLPQRTNLSLHHLFLFPNQIRILEKWSQNQSGLILFTGPTGSGKSTTLYALLEHMLQQNSHQVITLEDPVERELKQALQVQINENAGMTYDIGLKAALRHDPDIVMVGEIRDKHTARFAVQAALTGHLILSTLHAKDAIGTIKRLLEMDLTPVEIEQTLIAVAALELLPIQKNHRIIGRAAIMESLDGSNLRKVIHKEDIPIKERHSFNHLRKKAFAYGYLDKEVLFKS